MSQRDEYEPGECRARLTAFANRLALKLPDLSLLRNCQLTEGMLRLSERRIPSDIAPKSDAFTGCDWTSN